MPSIWILCIRSAVMKLLKICDRTTLSRIFFLNGTSNCNEIVLRMQTFLTAYSNYSLMEIIIDFYFIISRYVISNYENCKKCLDCVIILCHFSVFNSTYGSGTTGQQNRGVWVRPVWESLVELLGAGANTHERSCFIVAACYHHCSLDFWLINYHQVAAVLHCVRLTA